MSKRKKMTSITISLPQADKDLILKACEEVDSSVSRMGRVVLRDWAIKKEVQKCL